MYISTNESNINIDEITMKATSMYFCFFISLYSLQYFPMYLVFEQSHMFSLTHLPVLHPGLQLGIQLE